MVSNQIRSSNNVRKLSCSWISYLLDSKFLKVQYRASTLQVKGLVLQIQTVHADITEDSQSVFLWIEFIRDQTEVKKKNLQKAINSLLLPKETTKTTADMLHMLNKSDST